MCLIFEQPDDVEVARYIQWRLPEEWEQDFVALQNFTNCLKERVQGGSPPATNPSSSRVKLYQNRGIVRGEKITVFLSGTVKVS